jgi:hypothetical protein
MASIINASTSGAGGVITTADASGVLQLQSGGNAVVSFTNTGGTAPRITGDFSNATQASRVSFQSSTTNGNTLVQSIPNGTGTVSGLTGYSSSDVANSSFIQVLSIAATDARFNSGQLGTGTFLPITFFTGGSERMRIDTSGNLLFNSGYGSVATAYGCRAWVNFNGTGTVAIRASGNVTSITDNGVGDYTVNFTTAMPDANYSSCFTSGRGTGDTQGNIINVTDTQSSSFARVLIRNRSDTIIDQAQIFAAFFR